MEWTNWSLHHSTPQQSHSFERQTTLHCWTNNNRTIQEQQHLFLSLYLSLSHGTFISHKRSNSPHNKFDKGVTLTAHCIHKHFSSSNTKQRLDKVGMQVTIAQATSKAQNTLTCIFFFYKLPIKLIKISTFWLC